MKKIILIAGGALALSACGEGVSVEAMHNSAAAAVDEAALVSAVNQSIDRKAVEGMAHGAVAGAVREAIPPEVRAVGAVIDERALVNGIDGAIDEKALTGALKGAIDEAQAPAEN